MIKKIVFFHPEGQYGVTNHFTEELAVALKKRGVECPIYDFIDADIEALMKEIKGQSPDCLCTINPIRILNDGSQFCDHLKIPHLNCLVDASIEFLYLLQSKYAIISCVEEAYVNYLRMSNFKNTFFLPHGVSSSVEMGSEDKRRYAVTLLGTCIDVEERKESWPEIFNEPLIAILNRAIEAVLADDKTTCFQALWLELEKAQLKPQDLPVTQLFKEVELCVKGLDRINMLKSIEDVDVHVFGDEVGTKGWKYYLKGKSNIHVHDGVNFDASIKIMQESQVILNSFPFFKQGSHERILYGLAAGSSVLTSETEYSKKTFSEKSGVFFHRSWEPEKINSTLKKMLANHELRQASVKKGREQVMAEHTWDQRAEAILKRLPMILKRIPLTEGA